MIRNSSRKPTLEQRIARLENMIKNDRRSVTHRTRKFENVSDLNTILSLVRDNIQSKTNSIFSDADIDGDTLEIGVQDDMSDEDIGDEEYYDDWECNYVTYTVEPVNGMYRLSVQGNFDNGVIGDFSSPLDVAEAIIKDRK